MIFISSSSLELSHNTVKVAKTLNASHISMLKWSAFPLKHATGNTMSEFIAENRGADAITRPNWSAVFSVAFCVACLIIVEFLPVSLLTPMAQDLGISEGCRAIGDRDRLCGNVCQFVYYPDNSGH